MYQGSDSDRYLIPGERFFDNAADDLETIAVSKRSISLLPQKEVVRTDLQPFEQETQPLAKTCCVKMEDDTHQPDEMNSQMRVMKTYLKARYKLSDLLRAQRNDRMTSNRWIKNGAPDEGDLEEDSYRILRQYFMQKEGRLYLNMDGIEACKNVKPPKGTKKLLKKWRGPFMITEVHQEGRFHRISTGRAAHYENIEPHNPSTEDWCIPADMKEGDYLLMDHACEVNEKGTRGKNDGNEVVEEGSSPPLDLDHNEVIETDEETLPYAEEDWLDPEYKEVPVCLEPDLLFTIQTRQSDRTRLTKKYNPYGDDFAVDRIELKKIVEEVVGLEGITVSQDIDIVDDHDKKWINDRSKPEEKFDDEQQQSYELDLTNLRVLEWLNEMRSDPKQTSVTIHMSTVRA